MFAQTALLPASDIAASIFSANRLSPQAQPLYGDGDSVWGQDSVLLSASARARYEIPDIFSAIETRGSASRTKTLFEVGQDLQADLAGFENIFGSYLNRAGIDTSTEIRLQPDGKGHVLMAGDHPDKPAVERFFSADNRFVSRFMVMAARATLVNAAETAPGFRAAYKSDPFAAIKDNVALLKERLLSFQMRIQNGEFTPAFVE